MGSLESLQKRVNGGDGFVTLGKPASSIISELFNGGGRYNAWETAWDRYPNLFDNEPEWTVPFNDAPYDLENASPGDPLYEFDGVQEGIEKDQILIRSKDRSPSPRAIIYTYEQFLYWKSK